MKTTVWVMSDRISTIQWNPSWMNVLLKRIRTANKKSATYKMYIHTSQKVFTNEILTLPGYLFYRSHDF